MNIYTTPKLSKRQYDFSPIYYVYMYLREDDSENGPKGSPYYVGKGKNDRIHKKHNVPIPKDEDRIVFVIRDVGEETAFMWEEYWIAYFGRVDLGTGCLRNLTNGGEGAVSYGPKSEKAKKSYKTVAANRPKCSCIYCKKEMVVNGFKKHNCKVLFDMNFIGPKRKRGSWNGNLSETTKQKIRDKRAFQITSEDTRTQMSETRLAKGLKGPVMIGKDHPTAISCYFINTNTNNVFEYDSFITGCNAHNLKWKPMFNLLHHLHKKKWNVDGWMIVEKDKFSLLDD